MNCELCGRVAGADRHDDRFTFCSACALYACEDCWDAAASTCRTCSSASATSHPSTSVAVVRQSRSEAPHPASTRPSPAAVESPSPAATQLMETLPAVAPLAIQAVSAIAEPQPGMPASATGRTQIALQILGSIGPMSGVAPQIAPRLRFRPAARAVPQPATSPRRGSGVMRFVSAEFIGDLPFRFALGAILAISATFLTFSPTPAPGELGGPSVSATPESSLSPAGRPAPARSEPTRYRVRAGDTLRSIAVRLYGDEALWQKIYRANRATIDPENIQVGTVLIIPAP